MRPSVVVSVHDVSPATADETARWCADLDSLGVPASLLVIPGPWRGMTMTPDYARVLKQRENDEIVLHGWTHTAGLEGPWVRRQLGRAIARGAAEFAALDEREATLRIHSGRTTLEEMGLPVEGFTPPGWLASPGAVMALRAQGFRYLTTHRGLLDLRTRTTYRAFALSHRPGGAGERLGAALMRTWARRGARRGGLVRIALHPDDLKRPGLRDTTLRAIEGILGAGGRALTYRDLL
jgi:predicted deacetylase